MPKLYGCFEDSDVAYLVVECVEGVAMDKLTTEQRLAVEAEVERHLETLRGLKSATWGGPSGIVSPLN